MDSLIKSFNEKRQSKHLLQYDEFRCITFKNPKLNKNILIELLAKRMTSLDTCRMLTSWLHTVWNLCKEDSTGSTGNALTYELLA